MTTPAPADEDLYRDLARRWFQEVWNERSTEAIMELCHPVCAGHHEGQESAGPQDVIAMRDQLLQLLPDLAVTIEAVLVEGCQAVVRWRFEGRPKSPLGVRRVVFSGMTWLRFEGRQIVEGWDSWNQAALLQQLQSV